MLSSPGLISCFLFFFSSSFSQVQIIFFLIYFLSLFLHIYIFYFFPLVLPHLRRINKLTGFFSRLKSLLPDRKILVRKTVKNRKTFLSTVKLIHIQNMCHKTFSTQSFVNMNTSTLDMSWQLHTFVFSKIFDEVIYVSHLRSLENHTKNSYPVSTKRRKKINVFDFIILTSSDHLASYICPLSVKYQINIAITSLPVLNHFSAKISDCDFSKLMKKIGHQN